MYYLKLKLTILLSFLLIPTVAVAQYPFGKNKIQYSPKEWRVIETEHAEIYYYPDEVAIAKFIAAVEESIYVEYSEYFDVQFERKIPIICYGTHHDFKETNVIPFLIPESTGGFTEFVKGRVVLPFLGSYKRLRRILRHELVHAFMLEKLRQVMRKHRRFTFLQPPLWFTEGLAEYVAMREPDSEAEMFIRDAITADNFYPLEDLWKIQGTYLMYKEGESILKYIALNYGDLAIRKILENWWMSDRFDIVLQRTIGVDLRELSKKWYNYLKKRYYPSILTRRTPEETGICISERNAIFEIHPVTHDKNLSSLNSIYCVGYDFGGINMLKLEKDKKGEWRRKVFIRGEKTTRFESFPIMRSRVSIRGDTLVFVTKSGKRDAIFIYSAKRKKVLRKYSFEQLRILNSPSISQDGSIIVFSAIDSEGKSDIFMYNLRKRSLKRLTDDFFEDIHPDISPDNSRVIFSSDRCDSSFKEVRAIYELNIDTGQLRALTSGRYDDIYPRYLNEGEGIIFTSNRSGGYDVFVLKSKNVYRQTNLLGGAFDPYPLKENDSFLCSVYNKGRFKIYAFRMQFEREEREPASKHMIDIAWSPVPSLDSLSYVNKKYRMKLGLDLIGAAFALDPEFGYMGNGAQLFFTDILGNHQFIFLFGTATDNFDDIFQNLNIAFAYVNLEHRLNYQFGAFHLASYFGSMYDLLRFERRYGIMGGISYPISKFMRFEVTTILKGMERDDDITSLGLKNGHTWLVSNFFSFTKDNILWYVGGPMNGHRFNISFGNSIDLKGNGYESTTLMIDYRQYFNITRRIIFAQRFVSRNAWGSDLQLFYLGGSWDVRGYRFRQYSGKRIFFSNTEIRFPLIDMLLVKLPFGIIDFPLFRGSVFLDVGKVSGFIYDPGLLGSFGVGIEMNLGVLPVMRVNFCRLTDFHSIDKDIKIDFFLGYNF